MTMAPFSKQNAAFAILFVATSLLDCIKTNAVLSTPDTTSISPPSSDIPLTPSTSKVAPMTGYFPKLINKYLPPELFSQSDPLAIILPRMIENEYNGLKTSPYIHVKFEVIQKHVNMFLKARKFPRRYVPYAKLIYSMASCLARLNTTSLEIRKFQIEYPNESDYPPLSLSISNPELRSLFDADVFSDPNIPSVLVQKLVKIPNDKLPDVVKNLKKLSYDHNNYSVQWPYQYYIHFLMVFFDKLDVSEDFRDAYLKCKPKK